MKLTSRLSVWLVIAVLAGSFLAPAQTADPASFAATLAERYEVIPNLTYRKVAGWQGRLDLYLPYDVQTPSPTLIWFHGGGWTRSSKEQEFLYVLPYLEMGWAVVNVEYRLAATARAPAAVEDCRCAFEWLVRNAERYKLDSSKFVLSGISAGGHLALMTAVLPADSKILRRCARSSDVRPAAVINWFGPADISELVVGKRTFGQALTWFGNQPNRRRLAREISPITHIREGLPPIITIHGDRDDIIPFEQSVRFHKELDRFSVPNRLIRVEGRAHGDFVKEEWVSAYNSIRQFLTANRVL